GLFTVLSEVPQENFRFFPTLELKEIVAYLAAWSVLGLGSIPSQDVFQRTMSSGSAKTAVWSCYIAAFLYLTIAMLPLFISLCVKHLYPDQIGNDTQLTLPSMVLSHTSLPIQILFFGSLLSAIMSTTSSAILAPASIFSENFVKPLWKHRFSDNQFLLLTKISVLIFSVIGTIMACIRSNIYELVGESSILSLVSLFIPLTLGMYWKRATSKGALLSMAMGICTWLMWQQLDSDWPSLVPALIISLIAMVIGSLIWKDKTVVYDKN
ncbi:MAG TPA: sodium:solute symporter, partial [Cyclobacteriaceae bacterium]